MSDLLTDVIALGCGLVGKFVVTKLCEQGYDVHVVDLQTVSYTHLTLPTKRIV